MPKQWRAADARLRALLTPNAAERLIVGGMKGGAMLAVTVNRIESGGEGVLREWFEEMAGRREEVEASMRDQTVREMQAFIVGPSEVPLLMLVALVDDPVESRERFQSSPLAIDLDFQRVMGAVLGSHFHDTPVFGCVVDADEAD